MIKIQLSIKSIGKDKAKEFNTGSLINFAYKLRNFIFNKMVAMI